MFVTLTRRLTPGQKERARRNAEFVRANLATFAAMAQQPPETFAEKLKRAVAARQPRAQTVKEHKQYQEREAKRYRPLRRRERTKGE